MQASNDHLIVELQKHLLSNGERARIEKLRPQPEIVYHLSLKKSELHIFGTRHLSSDVEGIATTTNSQIQASKPGILLVEVSKQVMNQANDDAQFNQLPDSQKTDAILHKYGEQTYFAYCAQLRGEQIGCWDLPVSRQLQIAARATSTQAVIGWLSLYATKNLVQLDRPATPTSMLELIERFNERAAQIGQTLNTQVTPDTLQQAAEQTANTPYNELTKNPQLLNDLTRPDTTHPTNRAFLTMNKARDEHAMTIIYQALQQYSSVTITCGSAHATTWQPALEWLSQQGC